MTSSDSSPGPPRVGVSVALWQDGALLLVRRARGPYAGQWSLPGGRVEFGERLREAALRELIEETGISAEIGDPIALFEIITSDPPAHFVLHTFHGRYVAGAVVAGDDAAAAEWVALADLPARDVTPQTREVILKTAAEG
jgi:8-oxo-dGTP diphosphatase